MAEMLQSGQGHERGGQAVANSLNALLKKSKKPAVRFFVCCLPQASVLIV
jgi:hypothetical protein